MPRVYEVIAKDFELTVAVRYASTAADSKTTRDELVAEFEVPKKNVSIEQIEIPAPKADFLEWLNEKFKAYDKTDKGE